MKDFVGFFFSFSSSLTALEKVLSVLRKLKIVGNENDRAVHQLLSHFDVIHCRY